MIRISPSDHNVARYYRPIALPDQVETLARGAAIRPGSVTITLDDSYGDQVAHALPMLRALGLPATLAVVAGLIAVSPDATEHGERGSRGVSGGAVRHGGAAARRAAGVRLAGHSATHRDRCIARVHRRVGAVVSLFWGR